MGMREKLVELVSNMRIKITAWHTAEDIADMLIANDVVPVVRCKDCIDSAMYSYGRFCECHGHYVDDEFYCANGERKDNER